MAEKPLAHVLEAEDARLSRCFDATQLLFARQGFMKAASLKRLLGRLPGQWFATCDTLCALNGTWLAVVPPGLDDESGLEAARGLAESLGGTQPVVLCSLPHLRLRQMGAEPLLALVQNGLSAILKEPDRGRPERRAKGPAGANGREGVGPGDPKDGETRFHAPLVLDIAGGVPEDEARVSVEEKNFLFA